MINNKNSRKTLTILVVFVTACVFLIPATTQAQSADRALGEQNHQTDQTLNQLLELLYEQARKIIRDSGGVSVTSPSKRKKSDSSLNPKKDDGKETEVNRQLSLETAGKLGETPGSKISTDSSVRGSGRGLSGAGTTQFIDKTPPIITNITASSSNSIVQILWNTNEPADSLVDYGTTQSYGTRASSSSFVESHFVDLGFVDWNCGFPYYFEVTSTDESGNTATSTDEDGRFGVSVSAGGCD